MIGVSLLGVGSIGARLGIYIWVRTADRTVTPSFEKSGEKALFFLDLEIKGVKRLGLEVAKVIYKTSPFSLIVFVSTHSEYSLLVSI